jgi:GntR family transcriptional regulator / MocR family aminotransferase
MSFDLLIKLDRTSKVSLVEQIRTAIYGAIESGRLAPGTRLPSWQRLAEHLGVARGTVKVAYERLCEAQVLETFGVGGTCVSLRPQLSIAKPQKAPTLGAFMKDYKEKTAGPAIFQLGVPALDEVPEKLFAHVHSRNLLKVGSISSHRYPDPRGEFELRREIAGYLAISRNFQCNPEQVLITSGYIGGLGLVLRALGLSGQKVWMEEPGFHFARKGLERARLCIVPVPVDVEGIDVSYGIKNAPDAALAIVTPGQQAPLGVTLSLRRRLQLLGWAGSSGAWIIEDDYLSELQLEGRAAPALASLDRHKRVIHIGSFSKTVSPALRLGFIVAPPELTNVFAEVAATLAPAPSPVIQLATARFMHDGHYIQRVRRLKRLYIAQRNALCEQLRMHNANSVNAGLTVLLELPDGAPDAQIARDAMSKGMAPSPLSTWFANAEQPIRGLLLGIARAPEARISKSCDRLFQIIAARCPA